MIPVWSIVTLVSEVGVTACVFAIIWIGYERGKFMEKFALGVLLYELIFNISYMASRELRGADDAPLNPYTTLLAIFHGVFSLIMFAALIAFFVTAWRHYKCGKNFFRDHEGISIAFVIAWSLSILSGILLFIQLYALSP